MCESCYGFKEGTKSIWMSMYLESNVIAVPVDIMGRSPNTFVSLSLSVCVRVCVYV